MRAEEGEVSRKEDLEMLRGAAVLEDALQGPQNYRKESPGATGGGQGASFRSGLHTQKALGSGGMHWEASLGYLLAFVFHSWSRGQWGACYALVRGEGLDLFLLVYCPSLWKKDDMNQQQAGVLRQDPLSGWDLDEKQGPPHREVRMCLGSASQPSCGHRDTLAPQVHWETTFLTRSGSL